MFKVILKNDSYKGFDKVEKAEIIIQKEVKRDELMYNDEDIKAVRQPNLMQSMMEMQVDDSDDDEEEEVLKKPPGGA